jgi:acetyl-CoA synthetase
VTIYMPQVPEAAVAMLACARIGAAHSVIFGGFSSQAIADRVEDATSKIIITADGGFRRGAVVPLKKNVDEALTKTQRVENVIVLKRADSPVEMKALHQRIDGETQGHYSYHRRVHGGSIPHHAICV